MLKSKFDLFFNKETETSKFYTEVIYTTYSGRFNDINFHVWIDDFTKSYDELDEDLPYEGKYILSFRSFNSDGKTLWNGTYDDSICFNDINIDFKDTLYDLLEANGIELTKETFVILQATLKDYFGDAMKDDLLTNDILNALEADILNA